MTNKPRAHPQQTRQRCAIYTLLQNMGTGQYRPPFDRWMHLQHLQRAYGVTPAEERGISAEERGGSLQH